LGEEGAGLGEGIDVGGGVVRGLVAGEVVRAEGIDGDEDDGSEEEEEAGGHLIRLYGLSFSGAVWAAAGCRDGYPSGAVVYLDRSAGGDPKSGHSSSATVRERAA